MVPDAAHAARAADARRGRPGQTWPASAGVDDALTSRYAWIIGTVLAALAGVVGAPILGAIDTDAFIAVMFVASAAAVLGGLRSIPLAFAGGLAARRRRRTW